MRLFTVFISSVLALAGISAALPVQRENMLVARFADFDSFPEVEVRAHDEAPELYARGGCLSKVKSRDCQLPPLPRYRTAGLSQFTLPPSSEELSTFPHGTHPPGDATLVDLRTYFQHLTSTPLATPFSRQRWRQVRNGLNTALSGRTPVDTPHPHAGTRQHQRRSFYWAATR